MDRSLISFPQLSFGTSKLHYIVSSKRREDLLQTAISCGLTHIDTSPYYGAGIAQEAIGALSTETRTKITIASKVCLYPRKLHTTSATLIPQIFFCKISGNKVGPIISFSVKDAQTSLEQTLRQLRIDCLDILFLHEPQIMMIDQDGWYNWIQSLKLKGLIRFWGIAGERELLISFLLRSYLLPDIVQTRYTPCSNMEDYSDQNYIRPNFVYGLFSSYKPKTPERALDLVRHFLQSTQNQSLIFSSTKALNIQQISTLLKEPWKS